ncbi:FadR/GntR family transcriptional regulator [Oryzifoliimicrobium ureilyticus]|uniref:FadR/GntR family transcriptional regulator n=1 Tax=Oryzifoliimicrobium ureilyticus TaxID=3113724 RepID=UPI0030763A30
MKRSGILQKTEIMGGAVERLTARDLVSQKLTTLIATGMLQPGDELPSERELAHLLRVSRETVRAAIQTLVGKNFVEVSQGARSRVANVDLSDLPITIASSGAIDRYDLDAVHGARLLVELDVVARAAEAMSRETIEHLETLLDVQSKIGADTMRFLICDREFHLAIYRSCPNPLLRDFVIDLYGYLMDHRRLAMALPGAIDSSYADHAEIVESLKQKDPERVTSAFRRHLMRIYETTRALAPIPGKNKRTVPASA